VLPPAEFTAQQTQATQAVADATALAERVSKLGQGNTDAWRQEQRDQYSRVFAELTAAQTQLANGTRARSAAEFAEARAAASRAVTGLHALEAAITANIDNLTAVRRQAREVDQVITAAENTDRT